MRLGKTAIFAAVAVVSAFVVGDQVKNRFVPGPFDKSIAANNEHLLEQGRTTFRFDTFGDEAYWGDTLKLHQAIEGAAHGGVGPGLSPVQALTAGLKVDSDALPPSLIAQIKQGKVNLNDPAVTLALIQLNAVVGITGQFNANGGLKTM